MSVIFFSKYKYIFQSFSCSIVIIWNFLFLLIIIFNCLLPQKRLLITVSFVAVIDPLSGYLFRFFILTNDFFLLIWDLLISPITVLTGIKAKAIFKYFVIIVY